MRLSKEALERLYERRLEKARVTPFGSPGWSRKAKITWRVRYMLMDYK